MNDRITVFSIDLTPKIPLRFFAFRLCRCTTVKIGSKREKLLPKTLIIPRVRLNFELGSFLLQPLAKNKPPPEVVELKDFRYKYSSCGIIEKVRQPKLKHTGGIVRMTDNNSLTHSKWNCKYHKIFNLGENKKLKIQQTTSS